METPSEEKPKEPIEIAKDLMKLAWPNKTSKWYKRKFGFWLQAHFGRTVWTLKDLSEDQMIQAITALNNKRLGDVCCAMHTKNEQV